MLEKDLKLVYNGIKRGNQADFKLFFDTLFPHLTFYACKFVGKDKAEDIVQDVFVWVWENKNNIEMGDSFISFLYQSVYNKLLNTIERDKMIDQKHALIELAHKKMMYYDEEHTKWEENVTEQRIQNILEKIEELPEKGKLCLKMRYIQGMKSKEIAEILGISPRTVDTHIHNSIKALKKSLIQILIFAVIQ